jgi:tetratricopeptide (TPR) repeat protein/predicted Ser/Thr protein kinase
VPTVFISHSPEDSKHALRIQAALGRRGFATCRRPDAIEQFPTGHQSIVASIASADCVLVLWSQSCDASTVAEFEWTTAAVLGKPALSCLLDATPAAPAVRAMRSISLQDSDKAAEAIDEFVRTHQRSGAGAQGGLAAATAALPPGRSHSAAAGSAAAAATASLPEEAPPSSGGGSSAEFTSDLQAEQQRIGERYRLLRLLGKGGMGAVYLAHDNELDRSVAVKVIRPESAQDPEVVERFKREIQISSTITHQNVLRVYDLGEGHGIKFLTMEYVEGENLAEFLKREGRIPVPRLLEILRQICMALKAAHDRGVLHRDLKPANVMIDTRDRVLLTDFGIAKSLGGIGLTQSGAVMGTPHYMSPEQVKGEAVDLRSDIYSLGVMLFEMATGQLPFTGNTFYEVMIRRVQKAPRRAVELNPDLPPFMDRLIRRCMSLEKSARYASIDDVLFDLNEAVHPGGTASPTPSRTRKIFRLVPLPRAALLLPITALLAVAGWWMLPRTAPESPPPASPISVLVADFENTTGDTLFDGTLEETIGLGLEGASFVTTYNRGRARNIAERIRNDTVILDSTMARLVAQREGIAVIVDGRISRQGEGYLISARAVDAVTGKPLAGGETQSPGKSHVLGAVAKLSADIRQHLGDAAPPAAQSALGETFTSASLEAAHSYARAQELQGKGLWAEAIPKYEQAIQIDPSLGRAYAGLAVMHRNLGHRSEAEKYYQLALERIDRMTDREKYRTRGGYFVTTGNHRKAIEEFTSLVREYPADFAGHSNLALSLFLSRNMTEALEEGRRAMEIYPRNVVMRTNLALYAMYAGDFGTALQEAASILEANKSYGSVYVCLALSSLASGDSDRSRKAYEKLRALDASGASIAAFGLADLALYNGNLEEAAHILEASIRQQTDQDGAALERKASVLASVYLDLGRRADAVAAADRGSAVTQQIPVLFESAMVYLRAGNERRALDLAASLATRLQPEARVYAKLIEAEVKLARDRALDAIALCADAQKQSDTWMGRFILGRAYLHANAFAEAYSEFDQCMKRRGEATALFLDDIPTFHYWPPVHYYLGRAQEGLGSPAASASYRTFLGIKSGGAEPLVKDTRRRLGESAATGLAAEAGRKTGTRER